MIDAEEGEVVEERAARGREPPLEPAPERERERDIYEDSRAYYASRTYDDRRREEFALRPREELQDGYRESRWHDSRYDAYDHWRSYERDYRAAAPPSDRESREAYGHEYRAGDSRPTVHATHYASTDGRYVDDRYRDPRNYDRHDEYARLYDDRAYARHREFEPKEFEPKTSV